MTVCVHGRECLFGEVADGVVALNEAGRMVEDVWNELSLRFPQVAVDEFVVMPNHFHGIISIVGAPLAVPTSLTPLAVPDISNSDSKPGAASSAPTVGQIMRVFKSISAISVNRILDRKDRPLWQRNYYERIIRDENELAGIREYIRFNPLKWPEDNENPANACL